MSDLVAALRRYWPHARRAVVARGPDSAVLPGHGQARRLPDGRVLVFVEHSWRGYRHDR